MGIDLENSIRRRIGGFTIIELVVTMFIVGILATLVAPQFASLLPGWELRKSANELAADLRDARYRAIVDAHSIPIHFDVDLRRYGPDSRGEDVYWDAGIGLEVSVPESMHNDQQQSLIWFHPDGSSSGGQIRISAGDRAYSVSVNWLAGFVAVADAGVTR